MAARLTTYVVVGIVAATLIAGLIVGAQRDDSDGPVDLIVQNGRVYTAGPDADMAQLNAITSVTGGRAVAATDANDVANVLYSALAALAGAGS